MNGLKKGLSFGLSRRMTCLVVIGLIAVVVTAIGRRSRSIASPAAKHIQAKVKVNTVRPRRETLHRDIEQPGQIDAFERTALYTKIPGFVKAYHFDIGDKVRKGQLLAE